MWYRSARDAPQSIPRRPTYQDFTGGAAKRAVLKDTVQHPLTIFPIALGVAAGFLTVVTQEPLVLLTALGLVGSGALVWIYNFGIRGEARAGVYIAEQRKLQSEFDRQAIQRIRTECEEAGWDEGRKEAGELEDAYLSAKTTLTAKDGGNDVLRFEGMTDGALKEGIELLQRGLATFLALQRTDVAELEGEKSRWEKELRKNSVDDRTRRSLQERIDSHTRTISVYRENEASLSDVIVKVNGIGNALEQVNLAASRGTVGDLFMTGGVASQLELAVRAASKVEERLRGLSGGTEHPEDAEYARRGKAARDNAS